MRRRPTNMTLPDDLVAAVDRAALQAGSNRSRWTEAALMAALEGNLPGAERLFDLCACAGLFPSSATCSVAKTARALNVSRQTIYSWLKTGKLTRVKGSAVGQIVSIESVQRIGEEGAE